MVFFDIFEFGELGVSDGEVVDIYEGVDAFGVRDSAFPFALEFPVVGDFADLGEESFLFSDSFPQNEEFLFVDVGGGDCVGVDIVGGFSVDFPFEFSDSGSDWLVLLDISFGLHQKTGSFGL